MVKHVVILTALAGIVLGRVGEKPLVERARSFAGPAENPYQGDAVAARAGRKLVHRYCTGCHGRELEGIGKAPPLRAPEVRGANPAVLFWVLRNGDLGAGMPSFASLAPEQRWQIVTFLTSQ